MAASRMRHAGTTKPGDRRGLDRGGQATESEKVTTTTALQTGIG